MRVILISLEKIYAKFNHRDRAIFIFILLWISHAFGPIGRSDWSETRALLKTGFYKWYLKYMKSISGPSLFIFVCKFFQIFLEVGLYSYKESSFLSIVHIDGMWDLVSIIRNNIQFSVWIKLVYHFFCTPYKNSQSAFR